MKNAALAPTPAMSGPASANPIGPNMSEPMASYALTRDSASRGIFVCMAVNHHTARSSRLTPKAKEPTATQMSGNSSARVMSQRGSASVASKPMTKGRCTRSRLATSAPRSSPIDWKVMIRAQPAAPP